MSSPTIRPEPMMESAGLIKEKRRRKVTKNTSVKITLACGKQALVLPIVPESYEVSDSWNNQELNINKLGLITMIGKRGLKSLTISSFFPMHLYSFREPGSNPIVTLDKGASTAATINGHAHYLEKGTLTPWDYVNKIQGWRGKLMTVSISGTGGRVSWPCVIDGDFTYGEKDGSGDVYYTLTLKEYKRTNRKRTVSRPKAMRGNPYVDTGGSASTASRKIPYKTKKGDTLNKISQKFFGSKKYAKTIYKQNKKAVKKSFKRYMKRLSAAQKLKYKKKSKYNKRLRRKTKLVIKRVR